MLAIRCHNRFTSPGGSLPNGQDLGFALHAAVATLSAGPVTPSDGVGLSDRELIMRSCRSDGKLLHPNRPATYTDAMIAAMAAKGAGAAGGTAGHRRTAGAAPALPTGHLWSTYSEVAGAERSVFRWDHVLARELTAWFAVTPAVLTLDGGQPRPAAAMVAYSLNTSSYDLSSLQLQVGGGKTPRGVPFFILRWGPLRASFPSCSYCPGRCLSLRRALIGGTVLRT